MSNKVSVLVYSRRVGSPVRKAVLVYFAERASDNGEGVWASKGSIADAIECGRSTVIRTINDFVAEGILKQVGTRRHRNGETVEYAMDLSVIAALPSAKSDDTSPTSGPVPQRDQSHSGTEPVPQRDPYPSRCGTQTTIRTIIEPSDDRSDDRSAPSFEEFWREWPLTKTGKQKAKAAFMRLSQQNRMSAVQRVRQWAVGWRRAYPTASDIHPTTYLNGRRWEDEDPGHQQKTATTSRYGKL